MVLLRNIHGMLLFDFVLSSSAVLDNTLDNIKTTGRLNGKFCVMEPSCRLPSIFAGVHLVMCRHLHLHVTSCRHQLTHVKTDDRQTPQKNGAQATSTNRRSKIQILNSIWISRWNSVYFVRTRGTTFLYRAYKESAVYFHFSGTRCLSIIIGSW